MSKNRRNLAKSAKGILVSDSETVLSPRRQAKLAAKKKRKQKEKEGKKNSAEGRNLQERK